MAAQDLDTKIIYDDLSTTRQNRMRSVENSDESNMRELYRYLRNATSQTSLKKSRDDAAFWHNESGTQVQLANRTSERVTHELFMYHTADLALRERFRTELASQPVGQSEVNMRLYDVEQEAMTRVHASEMETQNIISQNARQTKTWHEELQVKEAGLQRANLKSRDLLAEIAAFEQQIGQDKVSIHGLSLDWQTSHEGSVSAQTEYLQAVKETDRWKLEHSEAMCEFQQEAKQCLGQQQQYL